MIIGITDADNISSIIENETYFLGPNKGFGKNYKQVHYSSNSSTQFGCGFTEYEKFFNEIKRRPIKETLNKEQ